MGGKTLVARMGVTVGVGVIVGVSVGAEVGVTRGCPGWHVGSGGGGKSQTGFSGKGGVGGAGWGVRPTRVEKHPGTAVGSSTIPTRLK